MKFNNNSFIDANFSLFNLNIRSLPKQSVNLQHVLSMCYHLLKLGYLSIINIYITTNDSVISSN